jgi:hypothetical protein
MSHGRRSMWSATKASTWGAAIIHSTLMKHLLDLDRGSLDRPESPGCARLTERCKAELAAQGMLNLDGFVRPEAITQAVSKLDPLLDGVNYRHARRHNIYFKDHISDLLPIIRPSRRSRP